MKANGFRIGNLVYRTNKLTKEKIVLELTASCILDISANGERSSFIWEPIPITEEWLLKFGFIKDRNSEKYFLPIPNIRCEIHAERYRGVIILEIHNHIMPIIPQIDSFVHELQNLYFALTQEELKLKDHE